MCSVVGAFFIALRGAISGRVVLVPSVFFALLLNRAHAKIDDHLSVFCVFHHARPSTCDALNVPATTRKRLRKDAFRRPNKNIIFLLFLPSARARPKWSPNGLPRTSSGRSRDGQVFSIWTPQARPRHFFFRPRCRPRAPGDPPREGLWATWAPRA